MIPCLPPPDGRRPTPAPTSCFAVGAAVRRRDGFLVCGSNVENASYGLTLSDGKLHVEGVGSFRVANLLPDLSHLG